MKLKHGQTSYYKGYGITKIGLEYRASSYANPEFSNNNLSKLKKEINEYLKS